MLNTNSSLGRLISKFLEYTKLETHAHLLGTSKRSKKNINFHQPRKFQISFRVIVYIVWSLLRIRCSSYAVPGGWRDLSFLHTQQTGLRSASSSMWLVLGLLVPAMKVPGTEIITHFQLSIFRIRGAITSLLHSSIMT